MKNEQGKVQNENCDSCHTLHDFPNRELLSGWSAGGTRYLLWKRLRSKQGYRWKLLGHLDFGGQRYVEPGHRVIKIGRRHFLTIDYMTVHGLGAGCNSENWYELQGDGLREVMSYPSWSSQMGATETKARSKISSFNDARGKAKVQVNFLTTFTKFGADNSVIRRWKKIQKAVFIWSGKLNRFILKKDESNVNEKEIKAICNL